MIGITASASAGAFFLRGEVVPAIDGPVAVGSVVGALFGARVLIAMSAERLRTLFILLLLLLLAALMALGASGIDIVRGAS